MGSRLPTENHSLRYLVALRSNSNEVQIAFPSGSELAIAICLTRVRAYGSPHPEVDRASAPVGLPDDNCRIASSRSCDSELALAHRLASRERARQWSGGIEPALACAQGGIVRTHRGAAVWRDRGPKIFGGNISARTSAKLLNVTPEPSLNLLAAQIVEDRTSWVLGENSCRYAWFLAQIQRAGDRPVARSPALGGRRHNVR